jgi:hypothetical protein
MPSIVDYAERGLAVVPFYTIDKRGRCTCPRYLKDKGSCTPGKHPRARKTKTSKGGYWRATSDVKQAQRWLKKWPAMNIGLAMEPGHLIALDVDRRHAADILLATLEQELGTLPETWRIRSGSGDIRSIYRLPADVDMRSVTIDRDGRKLEFIAGPGVGLLIGGIHGGNSTTPPGNPYEDLGGEIAELPDGWIEYLNSLRPIPSSQLHMSLDDGSTLKNVRYSVEPAEADPISLACAYWLWERHCPGAEFPKLGELWHCWMHDDEHPSAFFCVKDGHVLAYCQAERRAHTLAALYARDWGVQALTKAMLPLFYARLRLDSGVAKRPDVPHEEMPPSNPKDFRCLYAGFIEFMQCKWLDRPHEPQAFSTPFAAMWTGLPEARVKELWSHILGAGLVTRSDERVEIPGLKWRAHVYMPAWSEPLENKGETGDAWAERLEAVSNNPETGSSTCLCGCGAEIQQSRGLTRRWASDACRKRGKASNNPETGGREDIS